MKSKCIRLRLEDNGFVHDILIALVKNGFSVRCVHNEGEKHVDVIFWDGCCFIEE
jgi:hypothetical protein